MAPVSALARPPRLSRETVKACGMLPSFTVEQVHLGKSKSSKADDYSGYIIVIIIIPAIISEALINVRLARDTRSIVYAPFRLIANTVTT